MLTKVKTLLQKVIKQNRKIILKMWIILLLWFSFLPQQNELVFNKVVAQEQQVKAKETDAETQRKQLISMGTFMNALSQIGFVLIWPLVALAWLAMDNTLVYGSIIWLDVPLWKVWQIVRTFANYTLWVLFLIWIIAWNFSSSGKIFKTISWPWDLIKKTLLASVLIQASWFLLMVMVDLSTILTYSVGGLPWMVLNEELWGWTWTDSRMFVMNAELNMWDYDVWVKNWNVPDAVVYYWSLTWNKNIAPCETVDINFWWKDGTQSFIIWRKFVELTWNRQMLKWYCMYYWSLVAYNDFYWGDGSGYNSKLTKLSNYIQSNLDQIKGLVDAGVIYPVSSWKIPYISDNNVQVWWLTDWVKEIIDVANLWNNNGCWDQDIIWVISPTRKQDGLYDCLYKESDISISNIMKKAWSMTWPFASLYSSMATYSNLDINGKKLWIWQEFVVSLINILFSAMLILPLAALVIVLFLRIWLLWITIALSPFLILIYVFWDVFKDVVGKVDFINKYLGLEELIKLLLMPVVVSFAVWISLVFMRTLQNSIWTWVWDMVIEWEETKQVEKNISDITGMHYGSWNLDVLWFVRIKMNSALLNLSWILTMFFWLWVTWFLLFWAIKRTKIWDSVWGSLQDFWKKAFLTTPIIPIWKNWLSLQALSDAPNELLSTVSNRMEGDSRKNLEALLWTNKNWKWDTGWNAGQTWGWNTVDYSGNIATFYGDGWWDFDAAFGLKPQDKVSYESTYANTEDMIWKIGALYAATPDEKWKSINLDDKMWSVYKWMIDNAKSKDALDKIVADMNTRVKDKKPTINLGTGPIERSIEEKTGNVTTTVTYKVIWNDHEGKWEVVLNNTN